MVDLSIQPQMLAGKRRAQTAALVPASYFSFSCSLRSASPMGGWFHSSLRDARYSANERSGSTGPAKREKCWTLPVVETEPPEDQEVGRWLPD